MLHVGSAQVLPNEWSQLVGVYFLQKELSFGEDMPLYVLQTLLQSWVFGKDESKGVVLPDPIGSSCSLCVGFSFLN